MSDDRLDERWQAHRDAAAVGEAIERDAELERGIAMGVDPRWAAEEAFYEALGHDASASGPDPGDLGLIERALAEAGAPASATVTARRRVHPGWVATVVAVAAAALVWVAWPRAEVASVVDGSWTSSEDGRGHPAGADLPLAVWLVADVDACGQVGASVVCAEQGTVVRFMGGDGDPRAEVERGRLKVREGTWRVQTPEGETVVGPGGTVSVEAPALARAEPPAIEPVEPDEPVELLQEGSSGPASDPAVDEPIPSTAPKRRPGLPRAPADPTALLGQARSALGQGDREQAARIYAELIAAHPQSSEANAARVSLGRLRLDAGRARAALSLFDAYLRRGGTLAEEAAWGRIQALSRLGRDADVKRAVESLERDFPRSVYRGRARALLGP